MKVLVPEHPEILRTMNDLSLVWEGCGTPSSLESWDDGVTWRDAWMAEHSIEETFSCDERSYGVFMSVEILTVGS